MRSLLTLPIALIAVLARSQGSLEATSGGSYVLNEDIGMAMNKAQVFAAAQEAWTASFAQEPGASVTLLDPDNGLIEGVARMNYRSKMLMGREETMGTVTYHVTIQAANGQCHVRVHDLKHTGNRGAAGGGVHMGPIMEGDAPREHYPGLGLGPSRRMHADVREAAANRLRENLRRFVARLRLLSGE